MSKLRLDHPAITVKDLKRSIEFYRDILGFEVLGQMVQRNGTFKIVYLQAGDARIELFHFTEKGRDLDPTVTDLDLGFKHLGFRVDDVDAVAAELKAKGVEFTVEPKDSSSGGVRLAFFKDPDGNLLEIISGELNLEPFEL